jgi:aspartate racemase
MLGITGGTGPESTIEYYRRLISGYHARDPQGRAPSILINSIDNGKMARLVAAGELTAVADYLVAEVERLARAGADLGLVAANMPHLVFDEVQGRVEIPMLSIVRVAADATAAAGLRRVALFGIGFTMRAPMYPDAFARRGIEVVVPSPVEQAFIHQKYVDELLGGIVLDETRAGLLRIVAAMKERDAIDALLLGGTELSLILREPTAAGLPVLDTTQIHVDAAVDWLLRE